MNNLAHRMTNKLELDMRALSRTLYNESKAFIFKVPEEMTQTPVDFFGFLPSGRAVLIECKQVKRKSLPIGCSNGLQGHQWNALELAHKCGAVSMLIWRNGEDTAVLSFFDMLAMSEGRRSISWDVKHCEWWEDRVRALLAL